MAFMVGLRGSWGLFFGVGGRARYVVEGGPRRLLSRVVGRSYWFFGDAMIFGSMLLRFCVILVCVGGGSSSVF